MNPERLTLVVYALLATLLPLIATAVVIVWLAVKEVQGMPV